MLDNESGLFIIRICALKIDTQYVRQRFELRYWVTFRRASHPLGAKFANAFAEPFAEPFAERLVT